MSTSKCWRICSNFQTSRSASPRPKPGHQSRATVLAEAIWLEGGVRSSGAGGTVWYFMMIPWEQKQQIDIWIHMDSYGYMKWKYDMRPELYTYIRLLLLPTNLLAHVVRERESKPQKDGKVFQGCCRQYVPIIFRFPTLLSILGLLYYIYVHIYIYICYDCVCHTVESFMAGRARGG